MRLRAKLTITLLLISLASSAMVGGIAYWMLMRDFRQAVLEDSFGKFHGDVAAYIERYGSWQQAERSEPFPRFVEWRHRPQPGQFGEPPIRRDSFFERRARPAFKFLLLDPEGRVIKPGGGFQRDDIFPEERLNEAKPVELHGQLVALAVPLGDPNLSPQDLLYLSAMRRALITGFLVAGALAVLLGLVVARRMSVDLDSLTRAIRQMAARGRLNEPVRVRSRDEIGLLADAFNRMSTDLTQAHEQLRELSIRDPLTQLYNRRHFAEQASRLFEQAQRYQHPLTLMLGDLDHFKQINDTYSHAVGDEVLRRVGRLLAEHVRKSDVVARHGGEEFVIAFAETTPEQAWQLCDNLRRAVEAHPWHEVHEGLRVTMSMGLCGDLQLDSVERLLGEADANLYRAKHLGRNRVEPLPGAVEGVA
ncbi:GGDEF domain-containing protein [Pseudomonas sp. BMS12]|uniref:GGDEF domain-containing protein n=1 Tax=Pseudomonas sp. BMS12 TaxID=1796033 RepID=UPI00083A05CE|nr:GGDEF domain-containing protein [Pseudomonas sp. BMS12]